MDKKYLVDNDKGSLMVNYGICSGVTMNGKVFTMPHYYEDGNQHAYGSDGICGDCLRIRHLIKDQIKISTLEEKLNAAKALQPGLVDDHQK